MPSLMTVAQGAMGVEDSAPLPSVFRWDAPVPSAQIAKWQHTLEQMVPRSPNVSWLYLRWEAGDSWEPIQRFMIWQVVPKDKTWGMILQQLEGPHPRSSGHYCSGRLEDKCWCRFENPDYLPRNRWVGGPWDVQGIRGLISRQEWEIYREIGQWARPYWVIQGHNGGHRKALTHAETMAIQAVNKEFVLPQAGDLDYAEPDERTWRWIRHFDLMGKVGNLLERDPDKLDAEQKAKRLEAAKLFASYINTQSEAFWDEGGDLIKAVKNNLGYRPGGEGGGKAFGIKKDYEQEMEQLTERVARG